MSLAQDRLVLASIVLSESAWIFAAFGLIGLAFTSGTSPLNWVAVLAIMAVSLLIARFLSIILMPVGPTYAVQMITGAIVIYLTVATQVAGGVDSVDLGWIGNLGSDNQIDGYTVKASLGSLMAVVLWWRGGRLASAEFPTESLATTFKIGVLVLALAATIDMFHSEDLNVFPMMFIFFSASLAGLSVGQLLPASQQALTSRTWTRIIGSVVSGVAVIGLLFSLLRGSVLSFVSTPLAFVLQLFATIVFFVIIFPIGLLVELILRGLKGLIGTDQAENEALQTLRNGEGFGEAVIQMQEGEMDSGTSLFLQVIEYTIIALIVLVVLFFLAKAFRRRVRWRRDEAEGQRESVLEDADAVYDLAQLLFNLLPSRFRRVKHRELRALPDDEADVVAVFRMYYGMLELAEERGSPKPAAQTPTEYQSTLESLFPRDLVRAITNAFNRACYGHYPAPSAQIDEMRTSLENLATGG